MTDTTITNLPDAAALTGAEYVPLDQGATTVKAKLANIFGVGSISIGKSLSSAYTASIANPTAMSFTLQRMLRPEYTPIAPNLQTFLDGCVQDFGYYTRTGNLGTWSFSNGVLSVASTANTAGNGQLVTSYETFEVPSIAAAVEGITPTTDTGFNALAVGFYGTGVLIEAYMEIGSTSNNRINIGQLVGGVFTVLANTTNGSLPSGITGLACTVEGTGVIAWIQVNNGSWTPVLSATTTLTMFTPATLASLHTGFDVTGGITTPWKISRIRSGYSGSGVAFRDFKLVTNLDGTPYISDGYMYFTASNGLQNIWRMNPKNGKFEKVGILVYNRAGTIVGDLNANIVWDPNINKWRVFWASWANGLGANVKIFSGTYSGDILNGVHTVKGTQVNVTQQTSNAVYDECLVWDGPNSRWLLAYAVSPSGAFGGNMYIALDSSPDLVTWTNLWAQTGTTGYEGAAIAKIGGNFYVFAGNGSNYRVWNVAGTNLGTMTVDVFPPTSGNPPPHFVAFPWMDGDITQYYSLSWSNVQTTFNGGGVFSTGTPMLYKAAQTETGFELPALGVL